MSKRLRVWVDTARTVPFGGIDGYVADMLAALVPVPPTSVEYLENGWSGERGWAVTFDVPDDKLADPAMVQWLASGRARPVPLRAGEGGAMSIWGSLPGDDVWGWEVDYTPKGDPDVRVDVAINGSWNDCVRLAVWTVTDVGGSCMLNRQTARALAARLLAAADEVDKRWPT